MAARDGFTRTGWFGADVYPHRTGVYERDYGAGILYAYFDAPTCRWFHASPTPDFAIQEYENNLVSRVRVPWRGWCGVKLKAD